jgi:hypothetical protein
MKQETTFHCVYFYRTVNVTFDIGLLFVNQLLVIIAIVLISLSFVEASSGNSGVATRR